MPTAVQSYRFDIDGLRAVAVTLVVCYHYQIPGFSGGFVGVDVFFVISGYLISSLILRGLNEKTFTFISFYERRIRRIFPVLFVVLATSLVLATIIYDYDTLKYYAKTLISTVLFGSNFFFHKNTGYFAVVPQQIALLHTWSLSLEEQFYLLFPFALWLIHKYKPNYINLFILVATSLSFFTCAFFTARYPQNSFYLPPTRAWEFLVGSILATGIIPKGSTKALNLLSLVGFCLIIWSAFFFSPGTSFPGYKASLPVFGTGLLIYVGLDSYEGRKILINRILSNRFAVYIGKISYSMYLWHWVVFAFYRYVTLHVFDWIDVLIMLSISSFLSVLSWKFIEQPFRYPPNQKKKQFTVAFSMSILIISSFAFLGLYILKENGLPSRFRDNEILIAAARKDSIWDIMSKHEEEIISKPKSTIIPLLLGDKTEKPKLLIWGDSHAKVLCDAMDSLGKAQKASFYLSSLGGYPPLQEIERLPNLDGYPSITLINKRCLDFLMEHKEIKTVILVGRWSFYVGFHNRQDSPTSIISGNYNDQSSGMDLFVKSLRKTAKALKMANKNIVLLTEIPSLDNYPVNLLFKKRYSQKKLNNLTPSRNKYNAENADILLNFNMLKQEGLIDNIVPSHELFFKNDHVMIEENNQILYRDDDHLSYYGAVKVGRVIAKYLKTENGF